MFLFSVMFEDLLKNQPLASYTLKFDCTLTVRRLRDKLVCKLILSLNVREWYPSWLTCWSRRWVSDWACTPPNMFLMVAFGFMLQKVDVRTKALPKLIEGATMRERAAPINRCKWTMGSITATLRGEMFQIYMDRFFGSLAFLLVIHITIKCI